MFDLTNFRVQDMVSCAAHVRNIGSAARNLEEVSTRLARFFYEALLDGETTRPACALVRVYKTCPFWSMDAARRAFATKLSENGPPASRTVCLTLMATVGERREWCNVESSRGHLAIPLPSPSSLEKLPMIAAFFQQLHLSPEVMLDPQPELIADATRKTYGVVFVPDTVGSPVVPAQGDFVIPHRIRSALGFGGALPSGETFFVFLFSKVPIASEAAEMFRLLSLSVRFAVTPYIDRALFTRPPTGPIEGARA